MLVIDTFVPRKTMFTTDGCQLVVPSSRLGLAGLEKPYIARIPVARPEGLEPPTF